MGCHSLLQGNLPNPGIEPGSPTLQVDSLLSEPPGKPQFSHSHATFYSCLFFSFTRFPSSTLNMLILSFLLSPRSLALASEDHFILLGPLGNRRLLHLIAMDHVGTQHKAVNVEGDTVCQESNTYWMLWNHLLILTTPFQFSSQHLPNVKQEKHVEFEVICLLESVFTTIPGPCIFVSSPKHCMCSHSCLANFLSSCSLLSHSSPSGHARELSREDPFPQ